MYIRNGCLKEAKTIQQTFWGPQSATQRVSCQVWLLSGSQFCMYCIYFVYVSYVIWFMSV